jgi:predicted site-specific integrase-resolvase
MMTSSEPLVVSTTVIAKRYGVSNATIHRWWRSGLIPAPTLYSAKFARWNLEAVEAALKTSTAANVERVVDAG